MTRYLYKRRTAKDVFTVAMSLKRLDEIYLRDCTNPMNFFSPPSVPFCFFCRVSPADVQVPRFAGRRHQRPPGAEASVYHAGAGHAAAHPPLHPARGLPGDARQHPADGVAPAPLQCHDADPHPGRRRGQGRRHGVGLLLGLPHSETGLGGVRL